MTCKCALLVLTIASEAVAQEITNLTVTSAADWGRGLPSKGSLASLFCTGLQVNGTISADQLPLPQELAGVSISVAGTLAPVLAVASSGAFQQVNFQVPQEADVEQPSVEVTVRQGGRSATIGVPVRRSPGEFFRDLPSIQRGVFQHASDYSLVTPDRPARPGEVLIAYLTGLPRTQPVVPTGQPAPANPLAVVPQINMGGLRDFVRIWVGSLGVEPLFVGMAPGLVGVGQINFQLPQNTDRGDIRIVLSHTKCIIFGGGCLGQGTIESTPAILSVLQ